jgi:hypothetical protein
VPTLRRADRRKSTRSRAWRLGERLFLLPVPNESLGPILAFQSIPGAKGPLEVQPMPHEVPSVALLFIPMAGALLTRYDDLS